MFLHRNGPYVRCISCKVNVWTLGNFVFDDMDVINSLPGYLRRDVGNCLSAKYFNECEIKDYIK